MLVRVDDAEDPRLEDYVGLKEVELVSRRGRFVAEGQKVVELWAARGRYRFRSALLLESRADAMRSALAGIDAPIYVVSQAVLDRVAGFHVHRGVLASGERGALGSVAELLSSGPAWVLVGVGVSNHDNIGALFRNAAAFGAGAVLLDDRSADPLYRKAIRVSMGHALTLPTASRAPASELMRALSDAGYATWALSPRGRPLAERRAEAVPTRVALVVGSEGEGLDDALIARADERISIPMAPGVDSLNVATAAAIAAYALTSARS